MKYLKYIILVVVIIIIIIITTLLIIIKNNDMLHPDEIESSNISIEVDRNVKVLADKNIYYAIKNITEQYYYDLSQFNMTQDDILVLEEDENMPSASETIEKEIAAYKNKVYKCLDEKFISENKITLNNIQEKLGNYEDVITLIDNIYYADVDEFLKIYFVDGKVIEKNTLGNTKISMTILVDNQNSAFKIYPKNYKYNIEIGKELIANEKEIKNNSYNKYNYKIINEEQNCIEMLKDYKNRILYNIESAYNNTNEEYRKAKFGNLTEFKNYINKNYYKIINANIEKYTKTITDNYTQYTCVDKNNNYYIFRETNPMKYTLILDTYTIDIPEFVERYNKSNPQEKVVLNINKFMLSLNDGDYKYAYSILAESFKEKNFKTLEDFEIYAKSNFFEKNVFSYEKFGNEGDTYYTYEIRITDKQNNSSNPKTKTFIILLEDKTNFKISFNI